MKTRKALIDSSETVFALRRALGPLRAWGDFLADLARDKPKNVHVRGFKLHPVAHKFDRCGRPLYKPAEVAEFIQNVWAADPSLKGNWSGIKKQVFEFNDSPLLPWRAREAQLVT